MLKLKKFMSLCFFELFLTSAWANYQECIDQCTNAWNSGRTVCSEKGNAAEDDCLLENADRLNDPNTPEKTKEAIRSTCKELGDIVTLECTLPLDIEFARCKAKCKNDPDAPK